MPTLTYTVGGSGLVGSDTLGGGLATAATASSSVGTYAITQGTSAASSNYALTYAGANDVITARPITVTADAQTQVYGAAIPTLTYTVGGSGLVGSDTLGGGLATAATSSSSVGTYAITQGTLSASSNYALTYAGANDVITARPITVTADAQTQIYGAAIPTLTYTVGGSGLVGSDTLAGALATAATSSSSVGTYAITQGTLANTNYAITYAGANDVITARPITVTATAQTQMYGASVPTLAYTVGGSGLVGSDTLAGALATTATSSSAVGTYAITQGTLTASSNYALTYAGANDVITARPITVTADAQTQIYGAAVPTLTYTVGGSGLVGSDTLGGGLATTATASPSAGTYAITQGTLTAGSNYALTYAGANDVITARPITVTADAQTQIYGAAIPTLTYTVGGSGLVGSDTLGGGLATTATASSSAGTYAITQGTLSASSNYALTFAGANDVITARPITVTANAQTQIYGAAVPTLTYDVGGSGLVGSDTLGGALATAATPSSSVGTYAIMEGTLANANYAITYAGANDVITTRPITVTADAQTQVYGAAIPTLTYTVGGAGLVGSDTLGGALATTATSASSVGTYAINQGTLANANYAITYTGANDAITARPLTVTANDEVQLYGAAVPTLTYAVGGSGLVGNDTLNGALATAATSSSGVGSYGITQGTLAASSNYALTFIGASDTIISRPITVTVTADGQTQEYGSPVPTLTYTVASPGLVGDDKFSGELATTATSSSPVGVYPITLGTLTAGANYSLSFAGASDVITARPITVTADSQTQFYGTSVPTLTYTVGGAGLVGSDTLGGALATTATSSASVGTYAITQGTLAAGSNYTLTYAGANDVITARPITVTATAETQMYGASVPALAYTVGGSGLVGSDTLGGALATTATASSSIGTYAITQGTLSASSNYALTYAGSNDVITARPITVTANAQAQMYGASVPTLTYAVGGSGLVGSDTLNGGLVTMASSSSSVGTYAISQGTLSASSNYALTYAGSNDVVTARPITVTSSAQTQMYGASVPTLTYAVGGSGLVGSDTLSGGLATTASSSSSVGTYAISQGTLSASSNYALTYAGSNDVVTTRPITVTASAQTQMYGASVPTLTYAVGGYGLVGSDTLSGGLATTASPTSSVGTYAIALGTLSASINYALTYAGSNDVITARPIIVTANAQSQMYGAAVPTLTYTVGGSGLVDGDSLAGALATAATSGASVGSYAITEGTLSANDNYALSYAGSNDVITARPITIAANAQSQMYGAAVPTLTYAIGGSGLVGSDTLAGALATTATSSSSVGSYAITEGTLSANDNYALTYAGSNDVITARPITIAANAQSQMYGATVPTLTYTVGGSGLVGSDTLAGALTTTATASSSVGAYAITQGTLANANYAITYAGANDVITPRPVTLLADAAIASSREFQFSVCTLSPSSASSGGGGSSGPDVGTVQETQGGSSGCVEY